MKKLLLVLGLIFLCGKAWAMPDYVTSSEYSGSQAITTAPTTVYMFAVSYIGVTVGDKIQLLDGGSGGTVRLTCVASSVNGTCNSPLTVGSPFLTSLYYKETKTSGTFYTDIQQSNAQ